MSRISPETLSAARDRMVDVHVAGRGIHDSSVLNAMRAVPRERFVDPDMEEFAYEDGPLSIGEGQTISQPYMVALMIEAAEVKAGDRVLEVGAGSGYAAAVMGRIAHHVRAIERHAGLAEAARRGLAALGFDHVEIRTGDGTTGWPDAAPFDAIVVSAGGPSVPDALKKQLAFGGRLVIPIGSEGEGQTLVKLTRTGDATFAEEKLGAVSFVPLVGEQGWAEDGTRSSSDHGSRPSRDPLNPEHGQDGAVPDTYPFGVTSERGKAPPPKRWRP